MTDVVARAREALARRWENPGPPYPEPVPTGVVWLGDWASEHLPELVAALEQARAEVGTRESITTTAQLDDALKSHRLSPDGSIFAPESLQDIRDRLAFIEANECDCDETPHTSALHDLAHDDVPALLRVVEQFHHPDCPQEKP